MRDELRKLQRRLGITSLYVTHDQAEAMAISEKNGMFNEGEEVNVQLDLDSIRLLSK
ncbi:hypothetical protein SAMN05446037_1002197 [Anaerovirgula multivorans]|uniref:Uncharacterized protein n=1 Tax=Anaerovirgula multivorans TaxID=312168 RepID=A0A239AQF3_9FIRM|nr:hypothetical protein [Anaerovirgula multivorans]SNR97867.1 hypothetical protein SAMN05446037_1002197 [Anaerovirgula multivorans]